MFDAQLFAPSGRWSRQAPFALSLSYLRKIDSNKIVEQTINEIRDQGYSNETKLDAWFTRIAAIFPDVNKNTTITGVFNAQKETLFFFNGEFIGSVKDPEFGEKFFNIWLGDQSSRPKLRNQLTGGSRS